MSNGKIILDLCGGTGAWSKPYAEAGYDVCNITLPDYDVLIWRPECPEKIYGILAAPPCVMFSLARTTAKTPRDFYEGMKCVRACMEIIWLCRSHPQSSLKFWALENPKGFLRQFLGRPMFSFHPYEFGDRYTKGTDLWGYFNCPKKSPVKLTEEEHALCKVNNRKLPSIRDLSGQANRRAITPAGFANSFFKVNK